MEKVRPWCGQPSDLGRLRNRTELLEPRRKVWLTPAAGVPCSNAANIYENARLVRKMNFAPGKIPSGGQEPSKMHISL